MCLLESLKVLFECIFDNDRIKKAVELLSFLQGSEEFFVLSFYLRKSDWFGKNCGFLRKYLFVSYLFEI